MQDIESSIFEKAVKDPRKTEKGKRVPSQGHKGSLWSRARFWRKFFIEAGVCETRQIYDKETAENENIAAEKDSGTCIRLDNFAKIFVIFYDKLHLSNV